MSPVRHVITLLCIFLLTFPSSLLARAPLGSGPRTVAIVPLHDGSGDVTTDELAKSLATALPQLGPIRVVRSATTRMVTVGAVSAERSPMAADLAAAKKAYLGFSNRRALTHIDTIVQQFRAHPDWSSTHGEVLADALLTKALIHHSERAQGQMTATLEEFVQVAPALILEEARYPPSLRQTWLQIRQGRLAGRPVGTLRVESRPPFAEVRVNGLKVGVTPLPEVVLPEGEYRVTVTAPRYRSHEQQIRVRGGRTVRVTPRLQWQRGGVPPVDPVAADAVKTGLRVADQLKADAIVLVDVDRDSDASDGGTDSPAGTGGTITFRAVDRVARASFPPLTTRFGADRKALHAQLGAMTTQVADLITRGAFARSNRLDRIEPGSRALLASRKRRVSPWVWALVGSAVGGGVLAGLLLGGGGSGGPGTGGLVLQLR